MRATLRTAALIILSAAALAYSAPDIILPWHPFGTFGFDADPASGEITGVLPDSAAADADVETGDVIDLHSTPAEQHQYIAVYSPARIGTTETFAFNDARGHRAVTLTARARTRSVTDNLTDIFLILVQASFVLIGAALVFVRPSLMTWAFFIYALSAASRSLVMAETLTSTGLALLNSWGTLTSAFGWIGLVVFALRFPNDRVSGWRKTLETLVFAVAVILAGICAYLILGHLGLAPTGSAHVRLDRLLVEVSLIGFALGIGVLAASYASAPLQERPRLGWVLTGFLVGFGGELTVRAIERLGNIAPPLWLVNILLSLNIVVPLAVAYAIIQYRVIDVRFFLNRALVYGVLTFFALAAITIIDDLISKRVQNFHFGILWELVLALAIGLGIQRMHNWVDRLVDRFVFRSVHDAEQHLDRVAASMMQARSLATIDEMLCTQTARALRLGSSAVFHADGNGRYLRTAAKGWQANESAFASEDELVLALKAEEQSIDASEFLNGRAGMPAGDAAPILAVPFVIRHQVPGFALFGAHENGAAIDPDERQILSALVGRAAIAYDQVGVVDLDAQLARQQTEIAQLQSENDLLRTIAGAKPRV